MQQAQNSALQPEIEQAGKTAVLDMSHNQEKPPSQYIPVTTSKPQNSAGTPKIEPPSKTVAAMMTADLAEAQQDNTLEITGNSTVPVSSGPDEKITLLATEPGYTLSCHEEAADKQCWATHFQRNQTMERALRGVPESARLESAAASAFRNQEPIKQQQLQSPTPAMHTPSSSPTRDPSWSQTNLLGMVGLPFRSHGKKRTKIEWTSHMSIRKYSMRPD